MKGRIMNFIEERMHIFDTVRQYLYEQQHKGIDIPEWLDAAGFEQSKRDALYLNRMGLLGEFYNRIIRNTL